MNYRVVHSGHMFQVFKELCENARSQRRLVSALLAFKELTARLQTDPHELGELQYRLKNVGFPAHHAAIRPWSIHFTIDDQRKQVYIGKISLLG